jgi:hypothetical protein
MIIQEMLGVVSRSAVQQRRVLPTSPFRRIEAPPPSTAGYLVGGRVTHDGLGVGRIVDVDEAFITVDFGDGAVRQLRAGTRGLQRL